MKITKDRVLGFACISIFTFLCIEVVRVLLGFKDDLSDEVNRNAVVGAIGSMAFAHAYLKRKIAAYKCVTAMIEFLVALILASRRLAQLPDDPKADVLVSWAIIFGSVVVMSKAAKDVYEWYDAKYSKPQSIESLAAPNID